MPDLKNLSSFFVNVFHTVFRCSTQKGTEKTRQKNKEAEIRHIYRKSLLCSSPALYSPGVSFIILSTDSFVRTARIYARFIFLKKALLFRSVPLPRTILP